VPRRGVLLGLTASRLTRLLCGSPATGYGVATTLALIPRPAPRIDPQTTRVVATIEGHVQLGIRPSATGSLSAQHLPRFTPATRSYYLVAVDIGICATASADLFPTSTGHDTGLRSATVLANAKRCAHGSVGGFVMRRRIVGIALWGLLFAAVLPPIAFANSSGSGAPVLEITSPVHLSSHEASYDAAAGLFGATVGLSADVAGFGPDVGVAWISSEEGFLGFGESITADLHIKVYDSAQHTITVLAFQGAGVIRSDRVELNIWKQSPKCLTHTHMHWHETQPRHNDEHTHCERPVNNGHHLSRPPQWHPAGVHPN